MTKTYRNAYKTVKARLFFCRISINGQRIPVLATLETIAALYGVRG